MVNVGKINVRRSETGFGPLPKKKFHEKNKIKKEAHRSGLQKN